MSSVITGVTGSVDLSVTVPDDGDAPDAADLAVIAETMVDNDAELDSRLSTVETDLPDNYILGNGTPPLAGYTPITRPIRINGAQGVEVTTLRTPPSGAYTNEGTLTISDAAESVRLGSRSVIRAECGMPALSGADWAFTSAGIVQAGSANGDHIIYPITAPHGSTLTAFSLLVQAGGGHGALPANMPSLVVYKRSLSTGGTTTLGSASDASASVGAYEAVHSVAVTGLSESIDLTAYRYYAVFANEFGANSASGFVVLSAKRTTTVTRLDEAS